MRGGWCEAVIALDTFSRYHSLLYKIFDEQREGVISFHCED